MTSYEDEKLWSESPPNSQGGSKIETNPTVLYYYNGVLRFPQLFWGERKIIQTPLKEDNWIIRGIMNYIDFSTITACGECCVGCKKKEEGICKGCIETDGNCKEWSQSGGCPIYKCANKHNVTFCGICNEFPCDWLTKKVTWNPNVVEHLRNLAITYKEQNNEE